MSGNAEQSIEKFDLEAVATIGSPPQRAEIQVTNTGNKAKLEPLLKDLPDGEYNVRVRAVDNTGRRSGWSNAVLVRRDTTRPGPPENARVVITITINGGDG